VGGTTVHISSAYGRLRVNAGVYPIGVGTGSTMGHRYWVPNGGPGLGGKVFDVDPTRYVSFYFWMGN
jgi:hypothetical protein